MSSRREFITLLGGASAAWPLAGRAQQAGKLPTIGFLGSSTLSEASPWVSAFVERLRELGWTEGRNVAMAFRWAGGRSERYSEIATEFVGLKVDVIVTFGTPAALATNNSGRADRHRAGRRSCGCWPRRVARAAGRQHHGPLEPIT
jgi:putative tryptophan/tyrosine transport system substrate-binding protein